MASSLRAIKRNFCAYSIMINAALFVVAIAVYGSPAAAQSQSGPDSDSTDQTAQEDTTTILDSSNWFSLDSRIGRFFSFCQILVLNQGTLGASIEASTLSSKLMNGRAGVALVATTNGSFRLSLDAPLGFSFSPVGASDDVNFSTSFSGTGSTNFSDSPGHIPKKLKSGITRVETHLQAERLSGAPFPIGNYRSEVTLRCE